MSGRGPDPKELRTSLVDSGWSVAPPPAEIVQAPDADAADPAARRLPNYEDLSQAPAVTQIDREIQTRLQAMQRASLGDSHRPALPNLPPKPSRPPPPSLPPPPKPSAPPSLPPPPKPSAPAPVRAEAPLPSFDAPAPALPEAPLPSFDAPAPVRAEAPLPSFDAPAPVRAEAPLPSFAPLQSSDSEPAEATEVIPRGAVLPPSDPRELTLASLPPAPSLLSALRQRVRFAGGEVPLWSLLAPMLLLLVLGSAFVAAAFSGSGAASGAAAKSAAPSTPEAPSALMPSAEAAPEPATTTTLAPPLPAAAADAEALEARRAEELSKDEALALAASRRQRELGRVALLRQKLTRDPGLFKDASTLAELRRAAEDPLTAPDALGAMADAPGPIGADMLYEVWTGTVARNAATELARSLVFSKEVRAKASPALAVALDLRIAETCEQNRELMPRVLDEGDRRSLALLAKLSRRYGCGANKRQDCYPCLREDNVVDEAMTAVKKRREPKPFAGK